MVLETLDDWEAECERALGGIAGEYNLHAGWLMV